MQRTEHCCSQVMLGFVNGVRPVQYRMCNIINAFRAGLIAMLVKWNIFPRDWGAYLGSRLSDTLPITALLLYMLYDCNTFCILSRPDCLIQGSRSSAPAGKQKWRVSKNFNCMKERAASWQCNLLHIWVHGRKLAPRMELAETAPWAKNSG